MKIESYNSKLTKFEFKFKMFLYNFVQTSITYNFLAITFFNMKQKHG